MITTTLNRIRAHDPCTRSWKAALRLLGKTKADDEPLAYSWIAENLELYDALWCCRAESQHANLWRMFALRCARRALARLPSPDPRSVAAVDMAERCMLALKRKSPSLLSSINTALASYAAGAAYAAGGGGATYSAAFAAAYAEELRLQLQDFLELVG